MAKREMLKKTSELKIIVSADKKVWTTEQDKAFQSLRANLDIKGFRKGKAPESIVKQNISDSEIWSKAIRKMLDILVKEAGNEIKDGELVLDGPSYSVEKLTKTELEIAFIYPMYPDIKLADYKSLGIKFVDKKAGDEEVNKEIEGLREKHSLLINKEGSIVKGDIAKFDFEGFHNDKPFDGGKAEGYELEIGSGQFIPGYEDAMLGLKKGDKKDIKVTFPKEYHQKELAGQPVVFKVLVKEVKTKQVPELNDDFAKEVNYPSISTLEELKKYFKEALSNQFSSVARNEYKTKTFEIIKSKTDIIVPAQLIGREMQRIEERFNQMLKQKGMDKAQYMTMTTSTEESLQKQFSIEAKNSLEDSLIFAEIAKAESIELKPADYDKEYEKLAKVYKQPIEQIKTMIKMEQMQIPLTNDRVIDALIKYNN